MLSNNNILLIIIIININTFLIGYLLGRLGLRVGVSKDSPRSFFSQYESNNNLSIDDKKVVVDINTDGLEKKYNTLGDVKKTNDNISDSVNKLKNLKR